VVAAVAGVLSGTAQIVIEEIIAAPTRVPQWPADVQPLIDQIRQGLAMLNEGINHVKTAASTSYKDLYARKLVDIAIYLVVAGLFCDYATTSEKKKAVAKYWLAWRMPEIRMMKERILSGEMGPVTDFDLLAGPVPVTE
jgi:hypothetical protein